MASYLARSPKRTIISCVRIAVGLTIIAAIVFQARHSIIAIGPAFSTANFFSYFTILSNGISAILLLFLGIGVLGHTTSSRMLEYVRGAAVTYMVVTGIVYALLLQNIPDNLGVTLSWSNDVLHRFGPLYMLLDWLLIGSTAISWRRSFWWLLFPLIWLPYTMIRGAITGWYPYPFLNPHPPHSAVGVTVSCIAIAVGFILICVLVAAVSGRKRPLVFGD